MHEVGYPLGAARVLLTLPMPEPIADIVQDRQHRLRALLSLGMPTHTPTIPCVICSPRSTPD